MTHSRAAGADSMLDNEIIELYWQRDEAAVERSQRAYGAYCFAIAESILHDRGDAEECVGDTWLRAWNAIPPQRPKKLSAFLGRITRNLALDRYEARRAAKRGGGETQLVLSELENCISAGDTTHQAVSDAEFEAAVNRFLRALPARERNIFLCRYWYMQPLKDVAGRFAMRETTVKASLHRSRNKLRAFLEKEDIIL